MSTHNVTCIQTSMSKELTNKANIVKHVVYLLHDKLHCEQLINNYIIISHLNGPSYYVNAAKEKSVNKIK